MGLFSFFKKKNKKTADEKVDKKVLTHGEADDDGQAEFLKDAPTAIDRIEEMKKNGATVIMESSEGKTKVYSADGTAKSEDEPAVNPGDKVIIQGQKGPISGVYLGNSLSVLKSSNTKSETAPQKVDTAPAKAVSAPAKTDTAPAPAKPAPAKVAPAPAKAAPAPAKATSAPAKADTAPAKAAAEKKGDTVKASSVKAAPVEKKPESKKEASAPEKEVSTETKAAKTGRFEIKKSKDGRYVFNLYAPNHVIVATSQVYTTTQAAINGINSIISNASKAPIEDQTLKNYTTLTYPKWELYVDKGGQYRFRLNASNGSCIVHSQGYTSKGSCKNGIESIIRCSANPEIDKLYLKKE